MAKISLICEQCGGNIILDNSHQIGTCEHCFAQFVIKQDQIVQKITQHITKYVYGYQGKDIEELLADGYKLLDLGDVRGANAKFRKAIEIEPNCWSAHLGYASTNGDRTGYLSMVPAYRNAYSLASNEQEEIDTFVDMTGYLPDRHLRSAFIRAFNMASSKERRNIFILVSKVIGCDESEIASLAIDLCPNDWRAYFAMAKFRQVRAKWCALEGNFFTGRRLPKVAQEVFDIFMKAYYLAKADSTDAKKTIVSYINSLAQDNSYTVLATELMKQIKKEG